MSWYFSKKKKPLGEISALFGPTCYTSTHIKSDNYFNIEMYVCPSLKQKFYYSFRMPLITY